jgi:Fe-S cluster assembly protein SufD
MSTGLIASEEEPKITDALLIAQTDPQTLEVGNSDCLRSFQRVGWQEFQAIPMPKRTDEAWRFANLKAIDISSYVAPSAVSDSVQADLLARSVGLEKTAGRMIFANDQLLQREVLSDELKSKGVIWEPIEKAAAEHEEIFRKHFMAQKAVLGSKKFAALHQAWVKSGTFLYVPRNVEISLPLEVFHWLDGEKSSTFPHTLLIAGENSKVTLVDYFQSSDPDSEGFACGVNDLYLEAGAKLTYVSVQNWSSKALSFQINSTHVGRDASAMSMNLNLGAAYARTESLSRLNGEGGRSDMLAVSVANGTQEYDQRTLQDHAVPNTASDLLYKNSLDDKARTIFAGLIRVQPQAHKTDAYQKVKNLLLSDECEANSAPGLEILADDVRCTHGATSGQIDKEELFYFLARGIEKKSAQKLIVHGFLDEVVQRLGNDPLEAKLSGMVHAKFEE